MRPEVDRLTIGLNDIVRFGTAGEALVAGRLVAIQSGGADVDSDRVDGFRCILRCAHRMLLELLLYASRYGSAGKSLSAAGPSH
jgi:hypothetical protein